MVEEYLGKTIALSGGFDPVHTGHLDMFEHAREIVGEKGTVIVFVNSDDFLINKKGKSFMSLSERLRLIKAFETVDQAVPVIDTDESVCETLRQHQPDIFANGGDRTKENIPEDNVCKECNIEMIFNVGGGKTQSSSDLLKSFSTHLN